MLFELEINLSYNTSTVTRVYFSHPVKGKQQKIQINLTRKEEKEGLKKQNQIGLGQIRLYPKGQGMR